MTQQPALDALQSYPILTEEVSGGAAGASGSRGDAGTRTVEETLRTLLGWRPRKDDWKGFQAALMKSFDVYDVEGHTEWKWLPRGYVVHADMGAITGAQASIWTRAKAAVDQALPILDGLRPLSTDADPEDGAATRLIVRTALERLVDELGQLGGPRVPRVDGVFHTLIDWAPDLDSPVPMGPWDLGGALEDLRDRLSLIPNRVSTVEEEQNLTNFIILVDTVRSLVNEWESSRSRFMRGQAGDQAFLGNTLIDLSRLLGVIAESVTETYSAMDSVFLRAAERQAVFLPFDDVAGVSELSLAELLDWVHRFAIDEGPHIIEDAGVDGVESVVPEVGRLRRLVQSAAMDASFPSAHQIPAFHTPRVSTALAGLLTHLLRLETAVARVSRAGTEITHPPSSPDNVMDTRAKGVLSMTPASGCPGENVEVKILAYGLGACPDVRAVPATTNMDQTGATYEQAVTAALESIQRRGAGQELTVVLRIRGNAAPGAWTVVVSDDDEDVPRPLGFDVCECNDDESANDEAHMRNTFVAALEMSDSDLEAQLANPEVAAGAAEFVARLGGHLGRAGLSSKTPTSKGSGRPAGSP
ncbi:MAG: hypothetical protein ACKVT1_14155 [Dehalococcoidia bacterium]